MRKQIEFPTQSGVVIHLTPATIFMANIQESLRSEVVRKLHSLGEIPRPPQIPNVQDKELTDEQRLQNAQYMADIRKYQRDVEKIEDEFEDSFKRARMMKCVVEDPPKKWLKENNELLKMIGREDDPLFVKHLWVTELCATPEGWEDFLQALGESTRPSEQAVEASKDRHQPKSEREEAE